MTSRRTSDIGTKVVRGLATVTGEIDRAWERRVEDKHAMEVANGLFQALQNVVLLAIKRLFFLRRDELAEKRGLPVLDGEAIEQLASGHMQRLSPDLQQDVADILSKTDDGSFELPVGTYGNMYAERVAAEEGLQVMEDATEQNSEGEPSELLLNDQ